MGGAARCVSVCVCAFSLYVSFTLSIPVFGAEARRALALNSFSPVRGAEIRGFTLKTALSLSLSLVLKQGELYL